MFTIISLSREWPATPPMTAIAQRRESDLTRDVQLWGMLVAKFLTAAEHAWDSARAATG
jgi:hypothetical protein